jgi:hypothetical protein
MQLSLFHPLGTLSHRVNEGEGRDLKQIKNIKLPEKKVSKSVKNIVIQK